jgi:hypothetical protein
MNDLAISWAGGTGLALVTGWVGYLSGVRQERAKERRDRNFTAAAELTGPLRELQRLLRWLGREEFEKSELTAAFISWSKAYDDQGHRLPREWRHVARSVRDAAGTVFGGVSLVHIRPDTAHLGLGELDGMWQDFADEYLGYVARCILEWGDSSREAPKDLMTYGAWLVRTGRRETPGTNLPQGISSPHSTVWNTPIFCGGMT